MVTWDDFDKIWASASPLTPYDFLDSNYAEGWNFIGATPPSRQMWDFLQKQNDEKAQFLLNYFDNYLPLSGGTLTGDVLGVTPPNGDNSKKLANTEFIQALASILVPTGCVQAFAGSSTPSGWLFCDGSAVSRITYAELYAVIGDTYGSGDGSTTFNLPNLTDKFIQGNATSGTEHSAGLPEIGGTVINLGGVGGHNYPINMGEAQTSGAFGIYGGVERVSYWDSPYVSSSNPDEKAGLDFYASRSNAIYGNSTTVQPPSVTMRYIIKY